MTYLNLSKISSFATLGLILLLCLIPGPIYGDELPLIALICLSSLITANLFFKARRIDKFLSWNLFFGIFFVVVFVVFFLWFIFILLMGMNRPI